MNAVNLLPRERRGRSLSASRSQLAAIGAVALVGGMGYWGYATHADAAAATADLTAARAEAARVDAALAARRAASGGDGATLRSGEAFVAGLAVARPATERLMRRVAQVTPDSVWFQRMDLDATPADPAAGTAPATGLTLEGRTLSHVQVARLMSRLWAVPGLGEPRLTTSSVETVANRSVIGFQLTVPLDSAAQATATDGALTP